MALEPGGTLLLVDAVVDPRNNSDRVVKLLDLEISALLPGGMRTGAQMATLVESCGFGQIKVHPTAVVDIQIIEAVKVVETIPSVEVPVKQSTDPVRLKVASPLPVAVPSPPRHARRSPLPNARAFRAQPGLFRMPGARIV